MTARERAKEIVNVMRGTIAEIHRDKELSIEVANTLVLTCDFLDKAIASALADERRRVWEEAAKECDQRLFNCQRVLDTRGYRMFQPGELAVWRANADLLRRLAEWIRAKAHAGQEG